MVYYYPCFRWRIRDRSRSGISQALKSILQSSTSTQPSFPRFLQAGFYVIGGSQSLRRRTSRLPLWQYPYEYFIRKCRTLQNGFPAFLFSACYPAKTEISYDTTEGGIGLEKDSALYQLTGSMMASWLCINARGQRFLWDILSRSFRSYGFTLSCAVPVHLRFAFFLLSGIS